MGSWQGRGGNSTPHVANPAIEAPPKHLRGGVGGHQQYDGQERVTTGSEGEQSETLLDRVTT